MTQLQVELQVDSELKVALNMAPSRKLPVPMELQVQVEVVVPVTRTLVCVGPDLEIGYTRVLSSTKLRTRGW